MLRTVLASAAVFAAPVSAIALEKAPVNPEHATDAAEDAKPVQMAALDSAAANAATASFPVDDALAAYAALQQDLTTLQGLTLKTSADVDTALSLVSRHDPQSVSEGYIAYLGIVAAQNPAFASESRSLVEAYGRSTLLDQLPNSTFGGKLRAAPEAMTLALGAAAADAGRFADTAAYYRSQAGALQKQPWAKRPIPAGGNATRLAKLRAGAAKAAAPVSLSAKFERQALAALPVSAPGGVGSRQFWDGKIADVQFTSYRPLQEQAVSKEPAFLTSMNKALTFSILYSLEAEHENAAGMTKLLSDSAHHIEGCINLGRLGFYNAVNAAHDQTELAASVRAHLETYAECFSKVQDKGAS